ncbi:MAG TPA: peptidase S8, partial [Bacteroides sp.]|nr:peptidase S8 [Bacteroides sp.]
MKYHLLYNVVAVAASLCLSCSDELPSEQPPQPVPEAALMDAVPGVVCMQVSEELAGRLSDAGSGTETRAMQSCLTRSADAIRLNSVEPVFRIGGKFEARQRRSGLHRWYKVRFDNEVPVSSAIRTLSKEQGVESVEPVYPIYLEGEAAWPLALPASDTRISNAGLPFNDPLLGKQWALHNDASLNAKFVAGADVNAFEAWKVT